MCNRHAKNPLNMPSEINDFFPAILGLQNTNFYQKCFWAKSWQNVNYIFLCQSVSKMFLGKIIRKIYIIYFCETEKPLIFGDPIEFFDLQRYDVYHSLERLSITQGTQTYWSCYLLQIKIYFSSFFHKLNAYFLHCDGNGFMAQNINYIFFYLFFFCIR